MSDEVQQPRQEWIDGMEKRLATIGIGRGETLQSITDKIKAAGLKIVALQEDPGRSFPTYSLYYAQVADPADSEAKVGRHYSTVDHADALTWATHRVLEDREQRQPNGEDENSPQKRSRTRSTVNGDLHSSLLTVRGAPQ